MNITIDLDLKETLKPELTRLNQELEAMTKKSDGFMENLLSYVLIGSGKRVRPALVLLCSRLGKSNIDQVRVVEAAVELIHIATLVHDDVIDKAAMRRGRKTVATEHGVDAAVLLGDHIYTYAFQKVAELKNPTLLQYLAESTSIMCEGEIQQLKQRYQFDLTEEEYFSFINKKTASLFGASARCGAILADQSEGVQQAMQNYAVNLGIAFQIVDDLLDLTGDEAIVGKTLRTDLMNGKMTLPLIHYRNHLELTSEKDEFKNSLQNPNGQIPALIGHMNEFGSIRYAEEVAKKHVRAALAELDHIPACKTRDHLMALAEMLDRRNA